MDSIVTARVPAGIKEQGRIALQKIGATPTDLVNAAYRYVLEKGSLPQTEEHLVKHVGKIRKLNAKQKEKLKRRIDSITFPLPETFWEGKTDDELLEAALRDKYASTY